MTRLFNEIHRAVHGALILSLTDTLGSLAVATKGHFMTGVSTDIGTSFVRPAGRVGDTLHAKAILTAMGGRYRLFFETPVLFFEDQGNSLHIPVSTSPLPLETWLPTDVWLASIRPLIVLLTHFS